MELSIEQKAKAYDEAIERAKKVLLDCTPEEQKVVEYISPELKESEDGRDERIRKAIIKETKGSEVRLFETVTNDEFIAWLEKQGQTFTKKDVDDAWLKGMWLTDGDCVVQTSTGEWYTELTTDSHRFNSEIPNIINKIKEQ